MSAIDSDGVGRNGGRRSRCPVLELGGDRWSFADVEVLEQRCDQGKVDLRRCLARCRRGIHLRGDRRGGRRLGSEIDRLVYEIERLVWGDCLRCRGSRRARSRSGDRGNGSDSNGGSRGSHDPSFIEGDLLDQLHSDHVLVPTRDRQLLGVVSELQMAVEQRGDRVDGEPALFRVGIAVHDVSDLDVFESGLDHLDGTPLHPGSIDTFQR